MKGKVCHDTNGFTLLELLISIAIIGMVLAGTLVIISSAVQSFQYSADQGANIPNARFAMDAITLEMRNAIQVTSPAVGTSNAVFDYVSQDAPENRRISIGTGSNANTILVINRDSGEFFKKLAEGRVTSLVFVHDGTEIRKFTVTLVLHNPDASIAQTRDTSLTTVVLTLNSI